MWNRLFLFFLSISFWGCSYSTFYVPTERLVYTPSSPAAVAISTQKTLSRSHKILGRVAAISWGGGEGVRSQLQEEAAKLGANLVIDLKMEKAFGRTAASGLAVLVYQEAVTQ
jgi:hypothetical protein